MNIPALAVLLWVVCGFVSYLVARDRGFTNGLAWFITGALFGPIGIVAAFVATPPDSDEG